MSYFNDSYRDDDDYNDENVAVQLVYEWCEAFNSNERFFLLNSFGVTLQKIRDALTLEWRLRSGDSARTWTDSLREGKSKTPVFQSSYLSRPVVRRVARYMVFDTITEMVFFPLLIIGYPCVHDYV